MEDFDGYVAARGLALTRFAYVLCGDRHLAEDVVQEVLARMHRRWTRVTAGGSPEAYVKQAIVRQLLSWRRRRRSGEVPVAVLPDRSDGVDGAAAHADRDLLWRVLRGLPPQQRAVLVLRHYEDLPDGQIAHILGCAPATVRTHAARAAATLRARLGDGAYDPVPEGHDG